MNIDNFIRIFIARVLIWFVPTCSIKFRSLEIWTWSLSTDLVLEFEMWEHFNTKQKSKSFTLCDCMVYPDPKFLKCKTKKTLIFSFLGWKLIFWGFIRIANLPCQKL